MLLSFSSAFVFVFLTIGAGNGGKRKFHRFILLSFLFVGGMTRGGGSSFESGVCSCTGDGPQARADDDQREGAFPSSRP